MRQGGCQGQQGPGEKKAGPVTASDLQKIVRILGNSLWCRYWLHFNAPQVDPWEMAISCVEMRLIGQRLSVIAVTIPDLRDKGFREEHRGGIVYYVICRTDEEGAPFRLEREEPAGAAQRNEIAPQDLSRT